MKLDVGVDLIEVDRIKSMVKRWGNRFKYRCFTDGELNDSRNRADSLAVRIAAKEACAKALGTGFSAFSRRDIEVIKDALGKPDIVLCPAAQAIAQERGWVSWSVSLSHTSNLAIAVFAAVIKVGVKVES